MESNKIGKLVVKALPNPVKQMSKTILRHTLIKIYFGVLVAHHFSFLCGIFCLVCLRRVSCVLNVANLSGLSIFFY
jgi:hypothetical protein